MQRFARVWTRSQRVAAVRLQPQRTVLKRSIVSSHSTRISGRSILLQQLEQRGFQTSSVLSKGRKSDAKPSAGDESDSDSGSESDSDSDLELADSDDEEDENDEQDGDAQDEELDDVDEDEIKEGEASAAQYLGVKYSPKKVKKYSAELEIDSIVISGGDFWTALDAAKGYDELVDLYCDLNTARNFPTGSAEAEAAAGAVAVDEKAEWEVPDAGRRNADIIPPIPGTYLTLPEVLAALEREKAINVYTVDLAGKSSLADYMIFTTGRSMAHMRRMADMVIQSMKARELQDDFNYVVEGRECDDWMIADCNNIVVHFMREDTRRILNLEDHWENMVNDKHRVYGDMTEDEYMDRFGTSELMEYLEEDDFTSAEDADKVDDVEWK